jgi:hypothetical protein
MRIFERDWIKLDEEAVRDLWSLEREGAIYTDLWQDHLNDFRHVRIKFTPEEIEEYVRSYWAYELFLRAGSPEWARDVPDIPPDIARRADGYVLRTVDGKEFGPPYHCPAAFLGEELEALVCLNVRTEILEESGKQSLLTTVKRAIDALTPSIRLFSRREKGLAAWPITCEDDIRDLLYAILRASVSDIRREEAVPSKAGMHKFVDLCSNVARLFIEVKWISKTGTWKQIVKQINDDVQSYVAHPSCETLVFIIIDAAKDIPDPPLLEKELSGLQTIDEKAIEVLAFVREP